VTSFSHASVIVSSGSMMLEGGERGHGDVELSTRVQSAPVLVVGNFSDGVTDYRGAQASARLLRNARLLSYAGWGHTAYGRSECTTEHVDRYLVDGTLPPKGTVCPRTRTRSSTWRRRGSRLRRHPRWACRRAGFSGPIPEPVRTRPPDHGGGRAT
jgi:TAP-like protein